MYRAFIFRSPIIEADVVKIFYNDSAGRYVAEDAFLSKAQLCDFPDGLCEDRMMGGTSGNHIRYCNNQQRVRKKLQVCII